MKGTAAAKSGLSQLVVFAGTPYSIEILRANSQEDWTVEVIDAVGKKIVWKDTAQDDAFALIGAITHIHTLRPSADDEQRGVHLHAS